MKTLTNFISSQFKNPRGIAGRIISLVQNVVNARMYRGTISLVKVKEGEKLLDIGYGNGHLLRMIDRKMGADLYGIDPSSDAKEMATAKNRRAAKENRLHLEVGDCCQLPFEEELFSAVTSINTIYFWGDPLKGLSEIRRVLKNGCSFINVVYTKEYLDTIRYTRTGYRKFEPEELVELGRQAGFRKIRIRTIEKEKSFAVIYTR